MPRKITNEAPAPETTAPAAPAAPAANARRAPEPPAGAEEVDSGDVDEMIALDVNESVEAVFMGTKVVNVTVRGKTQESRIHKLRFDDNVARGIWGSYMLDAMLAKIATGQRVWIAYLGKETAGTGNEMHAWRVAKLDTRKSNARAASLPAGANEVPF